MPLFVKRIANNLWKFVDIYLAFAVSIAAFLIGLYPGNSPEDVLTKLGSAITAISGALLLTSIIAARERTRTDKIITKLEKLEDRTAILALRSDFLQQRDNLIDAAQKEILFFVRYGDSLMNETKRIEKALEKGVKIRFMACSPKDDNLMNLLAVRADRKRPSQVNPDKAKALINESIATFVEISKKYKRGKVEVRTVKYLPPFVICMIDPKTGIGEALISIANFREPYYAAPSIRVTAHADREIFDYFYSEFESYWTTEDIRGEIYLPETLP